MHIYHVASATPVGGDPAPGAHPEGHRGEDRRQACDQAPEATLAERVVAPVLEPAFGDCALGCTRARYSDGGNSSVGGRRCPLRSRAVR
jgi:hypothetical protein